MSSQKTLIFFSNYLGFSGSEILLKVLLNDLVRNPRLKIILVGFFDGDLLAYFDKRITYISYSRFYDQDNKFLKRQFQRFRRGYKNSEDRFLEKINNQYPSAIWILNTICLLRLLKFVERNNIYSLLWVHEMPTVFEILHSEEVYLLQKVPQKIICVSEAVFLSVKSLYPKGRVIKIYPGIISENDLLETKNSISRNENAELKIGMAGRMDSNKDPIYFLTMARYLKSINENRFKLIWIGGDERNGLFSYIKSVSKNEGLEGILELTGYLGNNYFDTIKELNLFFLTSNYDSFPLVMLEASSVGIPIIGWDSGGISDFINDDQIGEIFYDRNPETIYNFLKDFLGKKRKFNKNAIIKRSSCFSREKFLANFISQLYDSEWTKI